MQNPVNKGIKKIMSKVKIPPGDKKYCYIGEFKGVRSCVEVKNSDTCMSGDIFPTHDVCINPSLRV